MNKERSKIVDQYAQNSGFELPENYFEDFATQFTEEHLSTKRVVWNRWRSWVYAAAAFAGIVMIGFGFVYMEETIEQKGAEYLASDDYIDVLMYELSEEELIEAILAQKD